MFGGSNDDEAATAKGNNTGNIWDLEEEYNEGWVIDQDKRWRDDEVGQNKSP